MTLSTLPASHTKERQRKLFAWAAAFCVTLFSVSVWLWVLGRERERLDRAQQMQTLEILSTKRASLEHLIHNRLSGVRGLEALVRVDSAISHRNFEIAARNLLLDQSGIRALQLAPRGVIHFVYPVAGNERSVDQDLLHDPQRGPAARRSITTRQFFLAGPFELYQGGKGLVGRLPIFFGETFWGFSQVVLDVDPLLRDAGLTDTIAAFEFALRGRDERGEAGEVFFGRPELFDGPTATARVNLTTGTWLLAAAPRHGSDAGRGVLLLAIAGFVAAISAGAFARIAVGRWLRLKWELEESRNVWQYALEGNGDGVWDWNVETGEIEFSLQWKQMLGYREDEVGHQVDEWTRLVHPDDVPGVFREIKKAGESPAGTFSREHRIRCADGSYRWVLTRGKVTSRDAAGLPKQMIGTQIDISERRRAEETLLLKDRAIESSIDAIAMADLSGILTYVNPAFLRMWGYGQAEEVLGRPTTDCWEGPENADAAARASAAGRVLELKASRKDGTLFDVEVAESVAVDQRGTPLCFLAAFVDITDRKQAVEAIRLSEERLRRAQTISEVGNWEIDLRTMAVSGSEEAYRIYGLEQTSARFPLDLIQNIVLPEYRALLDDALQRLLAERAEYDVTYRITRPNDGAIRWIHSKAELLSVPSGGASMVLGVLQDVTEQKIAEEKIQESEERYRQLVESSPNAIAVYEGGAFVYVNPAGVALFGARDESELLGRSITDFVHPDSRSLVEGRIVALLEHGAAIPTGEERLVRLDGSMIVAQISTLRTTHRGRPAVQIVAQDTTEQRRLQSQLIQVQKMQSIGTLAAGIAHDFNNILAIILGYAGLIERDADDPNKIPERIRAIVRAGERGASLVHQILMFTRQANVNISPTDLSEVVRELTQMLKQTFPRMITFEERCEHRLPIVQADRTQIHQALLNLCVNARDAMPNGGTLRLTLSTVAGEALRTRFPTADRPCYVRIAVADTGVGMDEATRSRIFDPFFTTKPIGKGTGLGLSVVYGIARAHHGFVDVDSAVGRGAEFQMYLPAIDSSTDAATRSGAAEHVPTGGSETLLIVEDERPLLGMLQDVLEMSGYRIIPARDGQEAVDIFATRHVEIDLVLTDMGLPRLAGAAMVDALQMVDASVRVIVMSGYLEAEARAELHRKGVRGFLMKPCAPDTVLRTIRTVLTEQG